MNSLKSQHGMSWFSMLILIGMIGFFIVSGIKLGPTYMEHETIRSVMNDIAKDQTLAGKHPNVIWKAMQKRLGVNSISYIKKENFKYERSDGTGPNRMTVDYEVREPLMANIDTVLKFNYTVDLVTYNQQ